MEEFYLGLFDERTECCPVKAQSQTPVETVAPWEIAKACARVSVGAGLPPDGHCVQLAHKGQALYLFNGMSGKLPCQPVAGSESRWNVAGSKLPVIFEGESASGKDNIKDVMLSWLSIVSPTPIPATSLLKTSRITTERVLIELLANEARGGAQLQIVNGELEKVICKAKAAYLQVSDTIELLDGSDAFGKATGQGKLCVPPNVQMLLGAQAKVYAAEMEGDSKGRLRFVVMALDQDQVFDAPFEDKFVPRDESNKMLAQVCREILLLQQKPVESAPPSQDPQDTDNSECGSSDHVSQKPGASKRRRRSGRGRGVRLRNKKSKGPAASTEPRLDFAPPEVAKVGWSAAAGSIFAGVDDGGNRAMMKARKSPAFDSRHTEAVVSVIRKHIGRVFGALALGNLAARSGLLRMVLKDCPGRTEDALASLPLLELFGVNQMRLERVLLKHAAKKELEE